jgi:hypothetical protein
MKKAPNFAQLQHLMRQKYMEASHRCYKTACVIAIVSKSSKSEMPPSLNLFVASNWAKFGYFFTKCMIF